MVRHLMDLCDDFRVVQLFLLDMSHEIACKKNVDSVQGQNELRGCCSVHNCCTFNSFLRTWTGKKKKKKKKSRCSGVALSSLRVQN